MTDDAVIDEECIQNLIEEWIPIPFGYELCIK
jgi:hypothetical protein